MNGKSEKMLADVGATMSMPGNAAQDGDIAVFHSSDLFSGSREVIIQHQGEQYRLRCTSKGKLLLTK